MQSLRTNVRLDDPVWTAAKHACFDRKTTLSTLINEALKSYLSLDVELENPKRGPKPRPKPRRRPKA